MPLLKHYKHRVFIALFIALSACYKLSSYKLHYLQNALVTELELNSRKSEVFGELNQLVITAKLVLKSFVRI